MSRLLPSQFKGGVTGKGYGLFGAGQSPRGQDIAAQTAIGRQVSGAFGGRIGAHPFGSEGGQSIRVQQQLLRATTTSGTYVQRLFNLTRNWATRSIAHMGKVETYQKQHLGYERTEATELKTVSRLLKLLPTGIVRGIATPLGKLLPKPGVFQRIAQFSTQKIGLGSQGFIGKGLSAGSSILGGVTGALDNIGGFFGKWLPLLGLIRGVGTAVGKFKTGDVLGGLLEGAGGIASITKGLGPLVGIAISAIGGLLPDAFRNAFNDVAQPVAATLGEWILKGTKELLGEETFNDLARRLKSVKTVSTYVLDGFEHIAMFINDVILSQKDGKKWETRVLDSIWNHIIVPTAHVIESIGKEIPNFLHQKVKDEFPWLAAAIRPFTSYSNPNVKVTPLDEYNALRTRLQQGKKFGQGIAGEDTPSREEFIGKAIESLHQRINTLDVKTEREDILRLRNRIQQLKKEQYEPAQGETPQQLIEYIEKNLPVYKQRESPYHRQTVSPQPATQPVASPNVAKAIPATEDTLLTIPKGNVGSKREDINQAIETTAQKQGIDPKLLHALVKQESGYNPSIVSKKGAIGLTQLLPGTAAEVGVSNPFDIYQNLEGGVKYLKKQLVEFKGDLSLALAAYNAGARRVKEAGNKIPNIQETQNYVKNILANYQGTGKALVDTGKELGSQAIEKVKDIGKQLYDAFPSFQQILGSITGGLQGAGQTTQAGLGAIPLLFAGKWTQSLGLTGPIAERFEADISGILSQVGQSFGEQTDIIARMLREEYGENPTMQKMLNTMEESAGYQRALANNSNSEDMKHLEDHARDAALEMLASQYGRY